VTQTALGWLKVCYDVDKQEYQKWTNTFLFLLYMAVSWQLVISGWWKAWDRVIRGFLLSLPLGFLYEKLFVWLAGQSEYSSLNSPGANQTPVYVRS